MAEMVDAVDDSAPESVGFRLYRYRAHAGEDRRLVTGERLAESAYHLRASLRKIGYQVLEVKELHQSTGGFAILDPIRTMWQARQRRRRQGQLADFYDALATLLAAGLPLERALGSLAESSSRSGAERRMLLSVQQAIRDGHSLADALAPHRAWFDGLVVAMIGAGQRAGDLPRVLEALGAQEERGQALAHRVLMALAYPILLLVMAVGIGVYLTNGVLAELAAMVVESGRPVPGLTSWVLFVGQGLTAWWPAVVGIVVLGFLGGRFVNRRIPPGSWLARQLRRLPWVLAQRHARVSQLAHGCARLLECGMTLVDALEALAHTTRSRDLRDLLEESVAALRRGEDLSEVIGRSGLLEAEFAQLLALGEQSGELPRVLARLGERYERSAERRYDQLSTWLEPAAIVGMALLIGTVALAAALLMIELGNVV